MAEAMDFHVGRLIAHLKQTGDYDNTAFVFLSDNGTEGSDYREAQLWLVTQYSQDIDRLDHREQVHEGLGGARRPPTPPPFDGKLTFDKLTDVFHSGTNHEEDQPSHLVVRDTSICVTRCAAESTDTSRSSKS